MPLEDWSTTTGTVKFSGVVVELCKQTERQTDKQTKRHAHHNTLHQFRGGAGAKW